MFLNWALVSLSPLSAVSWLCLNLLYIFLKPRTISSWSMACNTLLCSQLGHLCCAALRVRVASSLSLFLFLLHFYSVCQLSVVSCLLSLVRCSVCYFHFFAVVLFLFLFFFRIVVVACRFYFHFDFLCCYRRTERCRRCFSTTIDTRYSTLPLPYPTLRDYPTLSDYPTYTYAQSFPLPTLELKSQVTFSLLAQTAVYWVWNVDTLFNYSINTGYP